MSRIFGFCSCFLKGVCLYFRAFFGRLELLVVVGKKKGCEWVGGMTCSYIHTSWRDFLKQWDGAVHVIDKGKKI
jgi:hypothetical protein